LEVTRAAPSVSRMRSAPGEGASATARIRSGAPARGARGAENRVISAFSTHAAGGGGAAEGLSGAALAGSMGGALARVGAGVGSCEHAATRSKSGHDLRIIDPLNTRESRVKAKGAGLTRPFWRVKRTRP